MLQVYNQKNNLYVFKAMSLESTCVPQEWEGRVRVKEEKRNRQQVLEEETDGQQEHDIYIEVEIEPTDLNSSLSGVVKEESSPLDLYAGHCKVEEDLVLGPERLQLPDSAFTEPTCAGGARRSSRVDQAKGPDSSVLLEQSTSSPGGSRKQKPQTQLASGSFFHAHLKEQKPYCCDVCKKSFKTKSYFRQHRRSHLGEKPYPCEMCVERFTRRHDLVVHRQTHASENRYVFDKQT